jgi:hypothetical protein
MRFVADQLETVEGARPNMQFDRDGRGGEPACECHILVEEQIQGANGDVRRRQALEVRGPGWRRVAGNVRRARFPAEVGTPCIDIVGKGPHVLPHGRNGGIAKARAVIERGRKQM